MSTNSQSFRTPFAGTRRFGSPPSVDVQPPLKKQRMDASGAPEGHDITPSLSLPERGAMNPSILLTDTEEDPLPDVNPVSATTKVGSSASKHASGAANAKKKPKRKKRGRVSHEAASPGDVLWREVQRLIGLDVAREIVEARQDFTSPFEFGDELVVEVLEVGAGGTSRVALFCTIIHDPILVILRRWASSGSRAKPTLGHHSSVHSSGGEGSSEDYNE